MTTHRPPTFIWSGFIALVFTLIMLQWSYDRFKLHSAPFLDDVNWIDEGLDMLASIRDGGLSGFVQHVNSTRTLAPYSIVAAAGFALFGIKDWVPYFMNGWLIFSLLAFIEIARVRARLPLRTWFLGAAVALAFPISGASVVSFLGDNASGLFLAIGAIAFLEGWPASDSRIESWAGTVAWVCAFFGKATLFPETMLVFVLAAVAGYVACRGTSIRRWTLRVAVVLLAVLPYYILVARDLRNYLYVTNWGEFRQTWAFKGTATESLLYYLTGFSGETMLGPALLLAIALILVRLMLLVQDKTADRLRFAALIALLVITYALPTYMVNKTPTVGSPFQWLLVLSAVTFLFAALHRRFQRSWIVELAVAGALLFVWRFPMSLDRHDSPAVLARNRILNGLITSLEKEEVRRDEPVFLTTTGFLSVNTLRYEFEKHSLPRPHFFELPLSRDPARFPPLIKQAAYVIATDPGNDEVFYTAPAAFIQAETLAMVQNSPAFVEVARFNTWRGKHYYLFGRRERVKNVLAQPPPDIAAPGQVWVRGTAEPGDNHLRWSHREFDIELPAPRGLYAELKLRFFLPQPNLDKLGPITLQVDIPREGHHSQTFTKEGFHDFKFRYAIKQHLVSTVLVRFRVNKVLPPDYGVLVESAELNPL